MLYKFNSKENEEEYKRLCVAHDKYITAQNKNGDTLDKIALDKKT